MPWPWKTRNAELNGQAAVRIIRPIGAVKATPLDELGSNDRVERNDVTDGGY